MRGAPRSGQITTAKRPGAPGRITGPPSAPYCRRQPQSTLSAQLTPHPGTGSGEARPPSSSAGTSPRSAGGSSGSPHSPDDWWSLHSSPSEFAVLRKALLRGPASSSRTPGCRSSCHPQRPGMEAPLPRMVQQFRHSVTLRLSRRPARKEVHQRPVAVLCRRICPTNAGLPSFPFPQGSDHTSGSVPLSRV